MLKAPTEDFLASLLASLLYSDAYLLPYESGYNFVSLFSLFPYKDLLALEYNRSCVNLTPYI